MIPNDLHYLFPEAVYLFFFALISFFLFFGLLVYRERVLKSIATAELLKSLIAPRSRSLFWIKTGAFCLAWICAVLALMQPIGNGHYPPEQIKNPVSAPKEEETIIKRKVHEVIFLMDTSISMATTDTRTGVPRLDYAKEVADEILSHLKGENVSLYAFTSTVTRLSPSTMDYFFVRLMLRQMGYNEGDTAGSNLWDALKRIRNDYLGQPTSALKTLILLTDGGDNHLEDLSGEEKINYRDSLLRLLENAEQFNLRVYTIGMGSLKGGTVPGVELNGKPVISIVNEDLLQKLSQAGRGKFYLANTWAAEELAEDLVSRIEKEQFLIDVEGEVRKTALKGEDLMYDLFFQIPLGCALIFLAFFLFLPDTRQWKGSIKVLFFGMMISSPLFAGDEAILERRAEIYYEAEQYEKSRELFKVLLEQNLHHWQKERLFYNSGNSFAAQGAWESASLEYAKIDLFADQAFYLSRAVETNQATLAFRQACNLLDKPQANVANYRKALFLLRFAEQKARAAQEAAIIFAKLSGSTNLSDFSDLVNLEQQAHAKLSYAIQRYSEEKIREMTVQDGLSLLQASVKLALEHLNFFDDQQAENSLKEKYLSLFIHEAESWSSLWDALTEKEEALYEAHQAYSEAIEKMKLEKIAEARKSFLDARVKLADLTQAIWGKDSLKILLQGLLASYSQALDQMPLQIFSLLDIKSEQEQVKELSLADPEVMKFLKKSENFLLESIASNQKAHYELARFFLYEAQQWIRRLLVIKEKNPPTPQFLLENAIQNASHALNLQRLYATFKNREERVEDSLNESEAEALAAASPFLETVIETEKDLYLKFCQCKPWDEVVPLFEKGWSQAQIASKLIKNKASSHLTMHHQERSITFWEEALAKLKQPQKAPPEKKQQSQSQSPMLETRTVDETLRQLQAMDEQDRPKKTTDVKPKPGLHSW